MNTVKKLAVLSIGLLLPASIHAADTDESSYIAKAKRGPGIPVPISVVAPEGHHATTGESAEVMLVVDAAGRPTAVTLKSTTDRSFGLAAKHAVKRWRFEPAVIDGKPIAVKVLVPFLVGNKPAPKPATFAANR